MQTARGGLSSSLSKYATRTGAARVGDETGSRFHCYYELHGHGPTRIVFVIGFSTTLDVWRPQVKFFRQWPERYTLLLFDNRGIGNSHNSAVNISTRQLAFDTLELLNALRWTENIHIVGLSLGGMIVQEVVAKDRGRFASVMFASTHMGAPYPTPPPTGVFPVLAQFLPVSRETTIEAITTFMYSKDYIRNNHDRIFKWHMKTWKFPRLLPLLGQVRAFSTHSLNDRRIKRIRLLGIPKLAIVGDHDRVIRPENSGALATRLRAELHIYPGVGHMINVEAAERFCADLKALVDSAPRRDTVGNWPRDSTYLSGKLKRKKKKAAKIERRAREIAAAGLAYSARDRVLDVDSSDAESSDADDAEGDKEEEKEPEKEPAPAPALAHARAKKARAAPAAAAAGGARKRARK